MNRDDIIRMALECDGLLTDDGHIIADCMNVERFAALIAAAEREKILVEGWRQCAIDQ